MVSSEQPLAVPPRCSAVFSTETIPFAMSSTAYIPFSEPSYIAGLPSPYYKETHLRWQKACREFVDKHLIEKGLEWDTEETVPPHVFETFAKANMLLPTLPAPLPVEWLKKIGITDILGVVKVEEWDYIHTMIYADEVCPILTHGARTS
ncbi:hypothetical protein OPT61_g8013 [Boeremia exigua]|uniref:Uncharacterized protein n=1 Tax=Boeremia exigua TaxID=749465 RepID=A0ACC2I0M4_9PLEO|nr:hypothetical protein OPT61_g8013 [Boeremia exigua]